MFTFLLEFVRNLPHPYKQALFLFLVIVSVGLVSYVWVWNVSGILATGGQQFAFSSGGTTATPVSAADTFSFTATVSYLWSSLASWIGHLFS